MAKYGMNRVTLIGNLGRDPEVRYLDQGFALAKLRLACTENVRDLDGNYTDRTEWLNVTLWRKQAEFAGKFLRKGSSVCIEGRLVNRSWTTAEGESRSRLEVEGQKLILLDKPADSFAADVPDSDQSLDLSPPSLQPLPGEESEPDDLPF